MIVRDHGFTLLEVLLAITVLGVVAAMLSLSLSGTLKVVDATRQQEEIYHQGQIAMRRITEDLAAALPSREVVFTGKKNELNGERADTLVFTSMAHLVWNAEKQKQGMAVISYQLQPDSEDSRKLRLLRADTLSLPGVDYKKREAEDGFFLLADNLRSIRFSYFNQRGQEFDTWENAVDSGQQAETPILPAAVHCTLEFWIDPEQKTSQTFQTGILLPVGAITTGVQGAN